MWDIKTEQKIFDINGVKIGGLPGERPTVLIGSIFYKKHKIVEDERRGIFNTEEAEKIITLQEEFSDKTGNPCMLDVVGSTPEALIKYLDFTSNITDSPILIGGVTPSLRIKGCEYAHEVGLTERVFYNSLNPDYKSEEINALVDFKLKNVVMLAYYMKEFNSKGRLKAINEVIPALLKVGVENIIIDTCVIDILSLGSACKTISLIKASLGYPCGCGAHNAVATWRGLKNKMGERAKIPSFTAASVFSAALGADFVLYGPIEDADYIFPTIALVDSAHAQVSIERGKRPKKDHPIYRIP